MRGPERNEPEEELVFILGQLTVMSILGTLVNGAIGDVCGSCWIHFRPMFETTANSPGNIHTFEHEQEVNAVAPTRRRRLAFMSEVDNDVFGEPCAAHAWRGHGVCE